MPIPGEQPDLTALPAKSSPVKRRLAAQYVREARDRPTSSSGTRPAFDYELLRQYAQNRLSASLVMLLLVATIGLLSSLWTGAVTAGAWTASVLVIHAVIITKCRQFLDQPVAEISARAWRLRFIILDLFYGLAWMFILVHPVGVDENSSTFMLFVMLLVVGVSSMLASSLPMAVFAALPGHRRGCARLRPARHPARLHPHHYGGHRAGLFCCARQSALFDHAGDAESARRKRCADRRARTRESNLRRGAAARGRRQHFQVALPRADEP